LDVAIIFPQCLSPSSWNRQPFSAALPHFPSSDRYTRTFPLNIWLFSFTKCHALSGVRLFVKRFTDIFDLNNCPSGRLGPGPVSRRGSKTKQTKKIVSHCYYFFSHFQLTPPLSGTVGFCENLSWFDLQFDGSLK